MSHESQVMSQIWLLKLSLVRAGHGGENEVAVSPLVLGGIDVVHESEVTSHESGVMSYKS
jgi:hypothetical protein